MITGGASGIGECTARLFAEHGAKVIIADVQDDLGHSICKEIDSIESFSYLHCDVTNESNVKNVVDTAISKHGKLDIMFGNAGIAGNADPSIMGGADYDNFRKVIDVNVFGAFLCAKHASRQWSLPREEAFFLLLVFVRSHLAMPRMLILRLSMR